MPPLDFPASPITGATYTGPNGVIWVWDGAKWVNGTQIGTAYAPVLSPVFTGNPTAPNPPSGDADTSVATTAFVSAAVAPAFSGVGRNYIHNPLFNVAQRGAGAFTTSGYTLDRWWMGTSLDTLNVQQIAATDADRAQIGDESVRYFLYNPFVGNAGATAYNLIEQRIEGLRRLSGKTITVSFWAVGTVPKLGVNMFQMFGTGGSPSGLVWVFTTGLSFALTTTWARFSFTVTIPSAAGKTFGTNGDDYTTLRFCYSAGANVNQLHGNIGVQSGLINIWGVQLEVGSVATPLEKPDPGYDFANCQRFFTVILPSLTAYSTAGSPVAYQAILPVRMRATPTAVVGTPATFNANTVVVNNLTEHGIGYQFNITATGMGTSSAPVALSADL